VTALIAGAVGPSTYWYLARGTGAVSLVLLTVSVVLGVLGSLRFAAAPRWPRFAIDALHRDVSLLAIAFLVVHIITSVLDTFAPVKLIDAVIPFVSSYRPLWMGLGALSFDLLIALVITSLARSRLGYRAWRAIHWLAYASWPIAVLHGLGTGSDTKLWWMLLLTVVCLVAVLVAVWVRIGRADPDYDRVRTPALVLSVAAPIGLAIFTLAGPLERGWAARAGTPASLLGKRPASSAPVTAAPARPPVAHKLSHSFSAQLAGTVVQTTEPTGAVVDLAMAVSGGLRGHLRVRLAGAPTGGGGLSMTGSQVDLTAVGTPSAFQGKIVALQGQQFVARVSDSSGSVFQLSADLNIDSQSGNVTGTLSGRPAGSGR
jgi:sulfoxide reductase heme-binding subunit YedZ